MNPPPRPRCRECASRRRGDSEPTRPRGTTNAGAPCTTPSPSPSRCPRNLQRSGRPRTAAAPGAPRPPPVLLRDDPHTHLMYTFLSRVVAGYLTLENIPIFDSEPSEVEGSAAAGSAEILEVVRFRNQSDQRQALAALCVSPAFTVPKSLRTGCEF